MKNLLHRSKVFLSRNSSTILTCAGGVGLIATTVLTAKATSTALQLLKEAEEEKQESLTKTEMVKVAGPAYVAPIVTGVATLACIFGANVLNKRQQAAITSAYALLDSSYKNYKNKVIDLYGEEVDSHIKKEIVKDKYEETDISVEDDNKQLFYDLFSERYFESTMEDVVKAEYEINRKISLWGGACLNEFYEALDIPEVDYGNHLGWSCGGLMDMAWESWLDFDHSNAVMDDGLECCIISFSVEPMFDYEYY